VAGPGQLTLDWSGFACIFWIFFSEAERAEALSERKGSVQVDEGNGPTNCASIAKVHRQVDM